MQICKGEFRVCKENSLYLHGITPAEALIFKTIHFKGSDGSPLHNLELMEGEAKTVTRPFKSSTPQSFNIATGAIMPGQDEVPEESHPRTNQEEIERLKKKYTGLFDGKPAFEATFGSAKVIALPQTFAEIENELGVRVKPLPSKVAAQEPEPEPTPELPPVIEDAQPQKKHWKTLEKERREAAAQPAAV